MSFFTFDDKVQYLLGWMVNEQNGTKPSKFSFFNIVFAIMIDVGLRCGAKNLVALSFLRKWRRYEKISLFSVARKKPTHHCLLFYFCIKISQRKFRNNRLKLPQLQAFHPPLHNVRSVALPMEMGNPDST